MASLLKLKLTNVQVIFQSNQSNWNVIFEYKLFYGISCHYQCRSGYIEYKEYHKWSSWGYKSTGCNKLFKGYINRKVSLIHTKLVKNYTLTLLKW